MRTSQFVPLASKVVQMLSTFPASKAPPTFLTAARGNAWLKAAVLRTSSLDRHSAALSRILHSGL